MFNHRLAMRLPPYLLFTDNLDSDPNAHSIARVADFINSYLVSVTGHTSLLTKFWFRLIYFFVCLFFFLYQAQRISVLKQTPVKNKKNKNTRKSYQNRWPPTLYCILKSRQRVSIPL